MKKKAYRATDVNKINIESLLSRTSNERIVFGIDIAKENNFCSLMNEKREVLTTVKWLHPVQTKEFIGFVKKFQKAEAVMEPSGSYGDPIRYMLEQNSIPVYRVSPKRSHDCAEVYDGVPSLHDAKSAAIIAKLHIDGASETWQMKQDHERDLLAAITTLDVLNSQLTQNANRIEGLMAKYWPEMSKYLKYKSTTFLELTSCFGGPNKIAYQKEEAHALMRKVGGHFLALKKIDKIIESAENTIGVPMTKGEQTEFKYLAERTLKLHKEVKASKKKVEILSQEDEPTKNISHVVGKATAAVIVTFCGNPLQYSSSNHWLKSFGLNLKEKSSGRYKGRLMITRRGSGRSRRWLYFSALRLIKNDKIVRSWYLKKAERDGGVKMKAIIAIMRKLVKALWYVARGEVFDTSKMFNTKNLGIVI